MTTLRLAGLVKAYPGAQEAAVRELSLTVASGSLTTLLGPSGSGKTTTMNLIAGLITPDEGEVFLDDTAITRLPPERRDVAMVFQKPLLFPHLNVAQNVGFGLRMRGLPPAQIRRRVDEMLDRVHLSGFGDRRPGQLSGGQQQRVALARALILRPKVLLLDEPLSSLDPALRDEMRGLIRELQRETAITTLIITHDQSEAVAISDSIALLLEGRIAQHDHPEALYRRPATERVARFFGGQNFVPGTSHGGFFTSILGPIRLPPGMAEGDRLLTFRPESLRPSTFPDGLEAHVLSIAFLGTQTRVVLTVNGIVLQALVAPDATRTLGIGDRVFLTIPTDAIWLLPPR